MTIRYPREYDTLNADQRKAYDLMFAGSRTGGNFFLTGNAGTGKSYLANVYAKGCRMNGLHVVKCAPTGIAAVNIDGVTMHSLFKLGNSIAAPGEISTFQMTNIRKSIVHIDVLFLDEVSMARVDCLDSVLRQVYKASQLRQLMRKGPIQVILCGDFGQLPPVVRDDDKKNFYEMYDYGIGSGYGFNGEGWKFMKFAPVMLREPMRQSDPEFCSALDEIRLGGTGALDYIKEHSRKSPSEDAIWICGKNKTVKDRNQKCLDALPSELHAYDARISGKAKLEDTNLESHLEFKTGARVMMLVNDTKACTYCNGSMGTILSIHGDYVEIRLDSGLTVDVSPMTMEFKDYSVVDGVLTEETVGTITQYPFKLGYAVTVHKSQGQTFEKVNLIPEIFCEGQLYVALSRCRSLANLYVQPIREGVFIDKRDVRANSEMTRFMAGVAKKNALLSAC